MIARHRCYCPFCHIYLEALSATQLCVFLNDHNYSKHPYDACISWCPGALIGYACYEPPDYFLLPASVDNEWGTARSAPDITAADRKWLSSEFIVW